MTLPQRGASRLGWARSGLRHCAPRGAQRLRSNWGTIIARPMAPKLRSALAFPVAASEPGRPFLPAR